MAARRAVLLAIIAVASSLDATISAFAQPYPSRPITMIVGYAAGGPTDVLARLVANGMRASLGQPVIIENVAGANATVGTGRVAHAPPNGYTIVLGNWNTHVANGAVYALAYDLVKDFEPVALIGGSPTLIVAKRAMPANDLKELVHWLKANPDKASVGTAGVGGSLGQVGGVLFQNATGTRFGFVPYRGAAPAMQDLVAGEIDLMFDSAGNSLPPLRAGLIKAYAVMADSRVRAAPDIPTVDEVELPGLYLSNWYAVFAPAGTARNIIDRLNAAIVEALSAPAVRARLADLGTEIARRDLQTPAALRAFQTAEIDKWWPILKAAGITAE